MNIHVNDGARIMDHRWGNRAPVSVPVKIYCASAAIGMGRVIDLSVSGAFVRTAQVPQLMTQVELCSFLASGPHLAALEAYVVRRTRFGFGIEWIELGPEAVCKLLQGLRSERLPSCKSNLPIRSEEVEPWWRNLTTASEGGATTRTHSVGNS